MDQGPSSQLRILDSKTLLASLAVALTVVSWASAFPLIKLGLKGFEPLPLAAIRFGIAALIAAAWLIAARPPLPSPKDLLQFVVCGAVGIALYNAFLNSGQQTVSAGAASFLINTSPILTAILAAIFLKERYGLWGWIGSLTAFGGVAVIASGQAGGLTLGAGASLVLLAALCQASYFILQRPLVPQYGAIACAAYTMIAGAILLSPWLLPAVVQARQVSLASAPALAVPALAIVPSIVGYAAWTYALDIFGASRAANFLYLVPPTAMLIAFILTQEIPTTATLLGGGVAIGGVALVNFRKRLEDRRARRLTERATA